MVLRPSSFRRRTWLGETTKLQGEASGYEITGQNSRGSMSRPLLPAEKKEMEPEEATPSRIRPPQQQEIPGPPKLATQVPNTDAKLSRSERKALERQRKEFSRTRASSAPTSSTVINLSTSSSPPPPPSARSNHNAWIMSSNSSMHLYEDLMRAMKNAQNRRNIPELIMLEQVLQDLSDEAHWPVSPTSTDPTTHLGNHELTPDDPEEPVATQEPDSMSSSDQKNTGHSASQRTLVHSLWARLTVAALKLDQIDLAHRAMSARRSLQQSPSRRGSPIGPNDLEEEAPLVVFPRESAALVRGWLRVENTVEALRVLEEELPGPESFGSSSMGAADPAREKVASRASVVNSRSSSSEHEPHSPIIQHEDVFAAERNRYDSELIRYRALALASFASYYLQTPADPRPQQQQQPPDLLRRLGKAVHMFRKLAEMGPVAMQAGLSEADLEIPWARLLQEGAKFESERRGRINRSGTDTSKAEPIPTTATSFSNKDDPSSEKVPCHVVYSVLDAMSAFPSENSDQVYEALSNALVRRVLFVTGAVDMSTCPPADRGEVAFLGRSNVGKSSLINMITNRKALAFTSKRPGKTQQFNYFAVNDKPGREREIAYGDQVPGQADADSFYLVDMPGFGYAKVPIEQRRTWYRFMQDYLRQRSTLRVIFHLVDGRLGPTRDDADMMRQVASLDLAERHRLCYVVVLTKTDKNVKRTSTTTLEASPPGSSRSGGSVVGKVSPSVMSLVTRTMEECGVGGSPVILSSAETKLGRDDLWRYLRLAAEPGIPSSTYSSSK